MISILEETFIPYGTAGVFAAAFLEEVIVPIPSALVLTGSGFIFLGGDALSLGTATKLFYMVVFPASLGMTIGSLFVYLLAYAAGKPTIIRWGRFFGISWGEIEKAEQKFTKGYYDELTLFSVRAIPFFPSVAISAFCGLARLKLKEYAMFTFLGTLVRASLLGFLGWQTGNVYVFYAEYLQQIEKIILLCFIIGIFSFLFYRIYKKEGVIRESVRAHKIIIRRYLIILLVAIFMALIFWGSITLQNFFGEITFVFQKYVEVNYFLSIGLFVILSIISVMFFAFSNLWLIPIAIPIWGNFLTFILLLFGWLVGGVLSYFIGRFAGHSVLKYFISKEKTDYYSRSLFNNRSAFALILFSRFILPSEIPGYVLGTVRYPFWKYFWVTFLSEAPYAIVTVYAIEAIIKKEPWIFGFWITLWFLSAIFLIWIFKKRWPNLFGIDRVMD